MTITVSLSLLCPLLNERRISFEGRNVKAKLDEFRRSAESFISKTTQEV